VGTALAPPARAPVGFSAEIERVSALRSWGNEAKPDQPPVCVEPVCVLAGWLESAVSSAINRQAGGAITALWIIERSNQLEQKTTQGAV